MTATHPVPLAATQERIADLWPESVARFESVGRAVEVPAEFAERVSHNGKTRLEACEYTLGEVGTARMVRILGTASEIVNTMIFPEHPDRMPLFAAELLVFGGVPRLAFVDLQTPGLAPDRLETIRSATTELAARYPLPADAGPPEWATHYSTGGYCYGRPGSRSYIPTLKKAYADYLKLWLTTQDGCQKHANESAREELLKYKRHHVSNSPGCEFMGKLFGDEWAARFLEDWLYR